MSWTWNVPGLYPLGPASGLMVKLSPKQGLYLDWLIDCFRFYAVSAKFQPCNGGPTLRQILNPKLMYVYNVCVIVHMYIKHKHETCTITKNNYAFHSWPYSLIMFIHPVETNIYSFPVCIKVLDHGPPVQPARCHTMWYLWYHCPHKALWHLSHTSMWQMSGWTFLRWIQRTLHSALSNARNYFQVPKPFYKTLYSTL